MRQPNCKALGPKNEVYAKEYLWLAYMTLSRLIRTCISPKEQDLLQKQRLTLVVLSLFRMAVVIRTRKEPSFRSWYSPEEGARYATQRPVI